MGALLEYLGFRFATALVALLPFRVLYILADLIAWVLRNVIGYRKQVVLQNLQKSFPNKSATEIRQITKYFYRHLADTLLESLKGLTMSKEQIEQRYHYTNPELLTNCWEEGRNAILMPAHYGNWEWGVLSLPLPLKHGIIGIYKPLKNTRVEAYAASRRTRFGLQLCPITETREALNRSWDAPVAFIFMADQSPSNSRKAHWLTFLNQDTACLQGADVWSRRLDLPVYYMDVQRKKRGWYTIAFHLLDDHPAQSAEESITYAYFGMLENIIRECPENWLWSHRRWKKKRPPVHQS